MADGPAVCCAPGGNVTPTPRKPQDNGDSAPERPRAPGFHEDQASRPVVNGWPPLVDRTAECQAITQAIDGTGLPPVVIAGPPGLGRTRLAREALTIAHDRGRRTRWATATEASALVPFGARAHLMGPVDPAVSPLGLLQQAVRSLTGGGGDESPVLLVDDVHLLDQHSIGLLHQLSAGTDINLVLTVRTSRSTADPVAHLWKDGLATRLELQPLHRDDADLLVVQALRGEVETRTSERLWRLGRGNPLFVFELLAEGRNAGLLRQRSGVWRWEGPMRPSQRLAEIALAQLGDLDEAQWRVLEVVAVPEPLGIARVAELSSPAAVASLVRRGVVVARSEGAARVLQTSHPLHTAVVRDRTSAVTLQTISQQLAELQPLPTSPEELRVSSTVLLDKEHIAQNPELLTEATRRANALLDHPLAERLARAGIEAGGGAPAHLALVEAAQWQGEPARSEQAAAEAAAC